MDIAQDNRVKWSVNHFPHSVVLRHCFFHFNDLMDRHVQFNYDVEPDEEIKRQYETKKPTLIVNGRMKTRMWWRGDCSCCRFLRKWIPKEVFEDIYRLVANMRQGQLPRCAMLCQIGHGHQQRYEFESKVSHGLSHWSVLSLFPSLSMRSGTDEDHVAFMTVETTLR